MFPFDPSYKMALRRWALAGLGSLVIHLGLAALAVVYLRDDDLADDLGAPAIEVGIELMTRRMEPIDVPPGPDVEASTASPAVVEHKEILEPIAAPVAVETQTEDPDRIVTPTKTREVVKDEPDIPTMLAVPSVPSIAAEATAVPTSENIQESMRSVTPVQGTGESPDRARATWQKELMAHFNRHKRYPTNPSLQSATILVSFILDETGHVLSSNIVQGSGDNSFDEAALAMIRRSDPVPKPPSLVAHEGLDFTLPVIFRPKRGS